MQKVQAKTSDHKKLRQAWTYMHDVLSGTQSSLEKRRRVYRLLVGADGPSDSHLLARLRGVLLEYEKQSQQTKSFNAHGRAHKKKNRGVGGGDLVRVVVVIPW
jgi:hypothetical protein